MGGIRISVVIYGVISIFLGIGLIGMAFENPYFDITIYLDKLNTMMDSNMWVRGSVAAIGVIIIFIWFIFRPKHPKSIHTNTTNGKISITLSALDEMIKKVLLERDYISNIKSRICAKRRRIIVNLRLILKKEMSIKEFADQTQLSIKNKLQSILGKDREIIVNVEVRKLVLPRSSGVEGEDEGEGPLRHFS